MGVTRKIEKTLATLRRHGPGRAAHEAASRAINTLVTFKILRGVVVRRPDPKYLDCPARYTAGFLSDDEVRAYGRDPANEMDEAFLREALAKGDACFAIREGGTLASYGWYSSRPTRIDPPDLFLRFSPEYVYMYKGFTPAAYRGQRLHAIGMTMALRHYLDQGCRGLVSYVESTNFDSLKSVFRMGYEAFGSVYVLKAFGRTYRRSGRGCAAFGFGVDTAPDAGPTATRPQIPTPQRG